MTPEETQAEMDKLNGLKPLEASDSTDPSQVEKEVVVQMGTGIEYTEKSMEEVRKSAIEEHGKSLPRGLVYDSELLKTMVHSMKGRTEDNIPMSDDYWKHRSAYHASGR